MLKQLLSVLLIGLVVFTTKPIYAFSDIDQANNYQKFFLKTQELIHIYEKQLGYNADPFAYVFNNDEANRIYKDLLTQEGTFFCEDSYFFKIRLELIKNNYNLNLEFIQEFLAAAERAAKSSTANLNEKQSHLLGLKMLSPYLFRFVENQEIGDTKEQPEKKEKEKEQNKEQEKKQDAAAPEWPPESDDSYKPNTKDLGKEKDDRKKIIIAEVNFKTPVFGQVIYDSIVRKSSSPFLATDQPWSTEKSPIAKSGLTNEYMKIYTLGKQDLKLFMPTGYIPGALDESEAVITSTEKGGYRLHLKKDFKELSIPLHQTPSSQLSSYQKDIYTRPVGISIDELPEKAQVAIIHKFDPKAEYKAEEVTKAIATHLAKDYLYSSGARPETDPIAALSAGIFQCDMAAYIMTAILRDIYKIPSRIVAGYRAKRANHDNKMYSYLVTPEDGHAWVEVFIDGSWRYFDPTPTKKDKEDDKKEKEKKDFSDWNDEEPTTNKPPENEPPTDQGKTQENKDDKDKAKEDEQNKANTESKDTNNDEKQFLRDQLDQKLLDVLLQQEPETNPLKKNAWRTILIQILNPFQSSHDIQNKLYTYENVFGNTQELKKVLSEAKEAHKKSHCPLAQWFDELSKKIFNQDINETYKDLLRIIRILEIYHEISDRADIKDLILEIKKPLGAIIKILNKMNSAIAEDIALVDDFKDNSPSLLWKSLRKDYSLGVIGANIPTQNLAKDIRAGKLNDKKLINALYEHTNFILNSSFKPGKMEVKTWLQESLIRGPDILPLTQFSDQRNAILMRPDLDIVENMQRGTAYHLTNRKKIFTESKKEQNEAQRITIVGFDTSGSMSGGLDEFQAALITAFACRAIDDVTASGKHRHKILLIPFDDKVGTPMKINNIDDILNLITNYKSWLKNTSGGTDIQKFLLQAMALIVEAQTNAKNPLDAANIIVMSDGESAIDYEELSKARKAIHRDTPLQAMFIALGSSNPDLKRFAQDAKKMGMNSQDLYRSFTHNEINNLMQKSQKNDLEEYQKAFYSLKKPQDISQIDRMEITNLFKVMTERTKQFKEKTLIRTTPSKQPISHKYDLSAKTKSISKKNHQERKIEAWLHEFREWVKKYDLNKDSKLFALILDDLMINFEKTLNVKFEDLGHFELEQLNHLLQTNE